ncbi:MAG TPA: SDR family NAD(P)-dependent oxidoreductase [Rhodoglobus sp.]|nr:SDR family NAD(P)-dependent oxidoreductase [Rhodoglobus sp.]
MSTILITGAATGIGRLSAIALARVGHTVYATMREPEGRNAARAESLRTETAGHDLRVIELDVQSQDSANQAVQTVLDEAGGLDVVVHNAAHLLVGYTEAFTAEDVAHLFDVNVLGAQRVNRAALPHLRERRAGTLLYVGSTTSVVVPPFLGPYVASKSAFDALAQVTSYEANHFGIETVIVMPGPFTHGTEHFPNSGRASDQAVTGQYAELDSYVARNEDATNALFTPGEDADPTAVANEITRILALPTGQKPARSVVDFSHGGVEKVNDLTLTAQREYVTRMGFQDLLPADAR